MLCPKCHRPLDGDEEYVCCAAATLQWTCRDCHKVSEGFAFPYGVCPLCGGTLAVTDPRRVEDAAALEAVRLAFEIELGGRAFYAGAARETSELGLKDLFASLAAMEEEHMATLARRYHADMPEASADFQVERAAIFAGITHRPEDPANLLRIAIACEDRAARFFQDRGAAADAGSTERQLYLELAAEERDHHALLATELNRRQNNKPGIL